jgi:hypothetical protein
MKQYLIEYKSKHNEHRSFSYVFGKNPCQALQSFFDICNYRYEVLVIKNVNYEKETQA